MICNNNNTIVITTTLANNDIASKRMNNLINNFSKYNIPIIINHGINDKNLKHNEIMFLILEKALKLFTQTTYKYAIICDDDFFPIDNFMEELNNTVSLLPTNWRSLHLAAGYLWGRKYRNSEKIGKLNPEYDMNGIDYHESGRFYLNCNCDIYYEKSFWLGGPIAFLLNKNHVKSFINDFVLSYNTYKYANDVILTKILNQNDYICREPVLGYENEQGGTSFIKN